MLMYVNVLTQKGTETVGQGHSVKKAMDYGKP